MITILDWHTMVLNDPPTRTARIYIANGGGADGYTYTKGGLPTAGNLQAVLDGMEAELWAAAQVSGSPVSARDKALAEGIQWFRSNPATKATFTLSPAALEAEVTTLVTALFPAVSAANRTKEVKIRMAQLMAVRLAIRGELEE